MAEYVSRNDKVTNRQRPVAVLLGMGLRPRDVSELTGYSERAIYNCMIRPQFKELVAEYADRYAGIQLERGADAITNLQGCMKEAVDVLIGIMRVSRDDNAKARAAINILHMGGLKPVDKKHTSGTVHLVITAEGSNIGIASDMSEMDRDLLTGHIDEVSEFVEHEEEVL